MIQSLLPLLFGIVIGLVLFYFISRSLTSRSAETDFKSASYNDAEIENILVRNGYTLKEKGEKAALTVELDGKSHLNFLVADFTAEKEKKEYVVHVRAADEADPLSGNLRQKLIELDYAFQPEAILLIDPAAGTIQKIFFKLERAERDNFMKFFIPLFIFLIIIGIISLFVLVKLI